MSAKYLNIALSTVLLFSQPVAAQVANADLNAKIDAMYAEVMAKPTDHALNIKYSSLLAQAGDYEGAIAPLERLLVNDASNAWLMLQLGTLYHALGSKDMAASYLNKAVVSTSASPKVVDQAKQLLSNM